MVNFTLAKAGRSGASIDVPIQAELVPAVEPGPFSWKVLCGSTNANGLSHLRAKPGVVVKRNTDPVINDIEFAVTDAYRERGFAVPRVKKIDETTLEIQRIDGLTFVEELFYDCHASPSGVVNRLGDIYYLARAMNAKLPHILTVVQKEYLLERQQQKLLNGGVSVEDAVQCPLSARVEARAKKLNGINVDPTIFKTLTVLEEVLSPLTAKYAGWLLESNGNNFIGDTRIDMNGIYFGVDDDSFLLDTPYMLSDTFWIRRRDEPHLSEYRWMEEGKNRLVAFLAFQQGEDQLERQELFQGSRVFRNVLQLFYAYNNAVSIKDKAEGDSLAQAKLYRHLNEMFAHYEMQDTGLNSILAYHAKDNSAAASVLRESASLYSAALEDMMRQMCDTILPDASRLGEYAASFTFIRENYRELKQNSPREI